MLKEKLDTFKEVTEKYELTKNLLEDWIKEEYSLEEVRVYKADNIRIETKYHMCDFYISSGRAWCNINTVCTGETPSSKEEVLKMFEGMIKSEEHINHVLDEIFKEVAK